MAAWQHIARSLLGGGLNEKIAVELFGVRCLTDEKAEWSEA